ncbi:elongation factor G [Thalassospira marina]|uniref:Elongation factor G n=1 Tax=Thalassospira marina TaxID=2048283 RepID=A0A2N3KWZ2_9PROT|nr:elongation factor G [Thalassospira marina]
MRPRKKEKTVPPSSAISQTGSATSQSGLSGHSAQPPRCAALVGPYSSGKSSLLESMLAFSGALHRKGSIREGTTIADSNTEARSRQMSIEPTIARTTYLDEEWHFIDCPGSVDFSQDSRDAVMVCDVAIVVVEADSEKMVTAAPILQFLDHNRIPHLVFINKTDNSGCRIRNSLAALQELTSRPLVLREIPLRDKGENEAITGFVDLVSERAYEYCEDGSPSRLIALPTQNRTEETSARDTLLEQLADFDDSLLEQILDDHAPANNDIYASLGRDLADDLIVPVFFGSAEHDHGIRRLFKALRHEAPGPEVAAYRLGIDPSSDNCATQIFKTFHLPHEGRFCIGRVLAGTLRQGDALGQDHATGLCTLFGNRHDKIDQAQTGCVIGLPRMNHARTGMLLGAQGQSSLDLWPAPLPPLYQLALVVNKPGDDVKLNEALRHLCEQDRSLSVMHHDQSGQLVLQGQGDIHLQLVLAQLAERYHLDIGTMAVATGFQETIRTAFEAHGRYKKQSGGHGQFGDVKLTARPLARGSGFEFVDAIVGGAIPRQYIGAVQKGIVDALRTGPLGFPVIDLQVTLTDGAFHAVDSSDQAFQMAGRIAIADGLKNAGTTLLEPVDSVTFIVPVSCTSRAQRLISSRRGQILGFNAREGWPGWDEIQANMPGSETRDMILELRSITLGTGFFTREFSHMQEISGKAADAALKREA